MPQPHRIASMVGVLVIVSAGHPQEVWRYKFQPGQVVEQSLEQTLKATMVLLGKQEVHTTHLKADLVWKVKAVEANKNARLSLRVVRPRLEVHVGEIKTSIEPTTADGGLFAWGKSARQVLQKLETAEYGLVLSPQGLVEEVLGVPDEGKSTDGFHEASVRKWLGPCWPMLPPDKVQKGTTWRQRFEESHAAGKLHSEWALTYQGLEAGLARVAIKPGFRIVANPGSPANFQVKASDGQGSALFDPAAMRWRSVDVSQSATLRDELGSIQVEYRLEEKLSVKAKGE